MKILILGAGGIGGLMGGRLTQAGADVTFLVRDGRRRQLVEQGLRIESSFGNIAPVVKTISQPEVLPVFDLVVLTCKAYDLPSAIDSVRPALHASTTILPLLNGIAHIDRLNEAFGPSHVLGGTAKMQTTLTAEGAVRQLNDSWIRGVEAR